MTSPQQGSTILEPEQMRVVNQIPVQTRSERPTSTNPDDFAPVHGRELEWRLTPVAALRPLFDSALDGSRYEITTETPPGVAVSWVASADAERGVAGLPEDRLTALAWSQTKEVLVIDISGEQGEPIRLTREALGEHPRAAHTLIRVAPQTHATLVMESRGPATLAETVECVVEEGSSLEWVSVHDWSDNAVQWASHFAHLGRDASLTNTVVNLEGSVVVVNPSVVLAGTGSSATMLGAYFAESHQHQEHRVFVHHEGPQTTSEVTYKGALHGKGARTVWIGDVLIGGEAVGTDSYEQNRNLVLSEGTRADSIPNLEIKTGDIRGAGHASATGRFDDAQLFYLLSRGIPEGDARRLIVQGFLGDVLQRISVERLRAELLEKVTTKLDHTQGEEQ